MFPQETLAVIERAITQSESTHGAEICFVVEGALHGAALYRGQSPRDRAIEVFSGQRMWDTEHRNAVLIYVLLADHAVEVIADRGAHVKVGEQAWQRVCREMEHLFKKRQYRAGSLSGIAGVTALLVEYFPAPASRQYELPDKPIVL
jgi:uncharacterized membrane protein